LGVLVLDNYYVLFLNLNSAPIVNHSKIALSFSLALIETVSPDLEKQGFFAVVFVNREYSEEQEFYNQKCLIMPAPKYK
jgi:hypothetical protein